MGKTAAASSANMAPKQKSKKSKNPPYKKSKKRQEADLIGIGSQFQQDNGRQQSSDPTNYPQTITLDD